MEIFVISERLVRYNNDFVGGVKDTAGREGTLCEQKRDYKKRKWKKRNDSMGRERRRT